VGRPDRARDALPRRRRGRQDKLCRAHRERWVAAGKPPLKDFAGEAGAVRTGVGECRVTGCSFVRVRGGELCDAHHRSYAWLRWRRGDLDIERFLAHVQAGRERTAPRFDLRSVSPVVALELGTRCSAVTTSAERRSPR
jgi:hypothetical protein